MRNLKTTNPLKLPKVSLPDDTASTLPYNGKAVAENKLILSFTCFDRTHDLFNLGDNNSDGIVDSKWFLDLFDCLKSVCSMTISQLKQSIHNFHPIDWTKTNVSEPEGFENLEYWQLRINKSRGRIIGIKIGNQFYIQWLDPHHNLTNSEGYGKAQKYAMPKSIYETLVEENKQLKSEVEYWKTEYETSESLLYSK